MEKQIAHPGTIKQQYVPDTGNYLTKRADNSINTAIVFDRVISLMSQLKYENDYAREYVLKHAIRNRHHQLISFISPALPAILADGEESQLYKEIYDTQDVYILHLLIWPNIENWQVSVMISRMANYAKVCKIRKNVRFAKYLEKFKQFVDYVANIMLISRS